jgi:hypothetical protein
MIPEHEIDGLLMTVDDALESAKEGDVEAGYDCIEGGLYRAEMLLVGMPWGPALVARYRIALAGYRENYMKGSPVLAE